MKKLVIAAIAAAALNTTASAENCASNFSGFYAGLQAGLNWTKSELKNVNTGGSESHNKTSFTGGLFTGYGMGIGQSMYVGGEVYGNLNRDKVLWKDPSGEAEITTQNNGNIGAKVRLGYVFSPQTMIFLGLGLEHAQWKVKFNHLRAVGRGVDKEYKKTISKVAFTPSIGTEMYVNKHIFVRGEYTYVAPVNGTLKVKKGNGPHSNLDIKSTFSQHRFMLGLGYKF